LTVRTPSLLVAALCLGVAGATLARIAISGTTAACRFAPTGMVTSQNAPGRSQY